MVQVVEADRPAAHLDGVALDDVADAQGATASLGLGLGLIAGPLTGLASGLLLGGLDLGHLGLEDLLLLALALPVSSLCLELPVDLLDLLLADRASLQQGIS